jgi:hypothetical protein
VHEGEGAAVGVLFLHYFLVSAAVIAGKAARDAYFLTYFTKSVLPLMYLADAVVITAAMAALARFSKKASTGVVTTATLIVFSASLFLVGVGMTRWMVVVFYIWMEVIGSVVILHAWLLVGNAFDPQQAKRLFGLIAAGGSIAAWAGGSGVAFLASHYGSATLVFTVAATLGVAAITARMSARHVAPRVPARAAAVAKRRKASPYVIAIAALVAASSILSALVQYRFQVGAAAAYSDRNQMLAFFGHFYAWSGVSSLVTQVFLSRLLLSNFGVIAGLAVLPISLTAGSIFTLLSPSLWSVGASRFADLTFKFTINNSSVEMLWLPVPPEERQSVKPFVSGTLKAYSEAFTGALMFLLANLAPLWALSAAALVVCAAWIATVTRLRPLYRSALASVIAKRQLSAEALRIDATDPGVIQSLEQALSSNDPAEQISALAFLDGFPLTSLAGTLQRLYREGSPEVREAVLRIAAHDRDVIPDEWVAAALREGAPAAADIVVQRKMEQATPLLLDMLRSRDVEASMAAASALLRDGAAAAAHERIAQWLDCEDPRAVAAAVDALPREMGVLGSDELRRLLRFSKPAAARAALRLAAATNQVEVLPDIVNCLANPRCALQARLALRSLDERPVVENMLSVVESRTTDEPLRRAVLRTLRDYPAPVAERRAGTCVEIDRLGSYAEFAALLNSIQTHRKLDVQANERAGRDYSEAVYIAYELDALRAELAADNDATLLRDRSEYQYSTAVTIALRLAALGVDGFPLDACLQGVRSGERAHLPYVLELMEASFPREQARMLIPLVDPSQRVQRRSIFDQSFRNRALPLDQRLAAAASSPDDWERAITNDYLTRKRKAAASRRDMLSTLDKIIYLKSSNVFGDIPAENLSTLAAIATESRWAAGTTIFREGDTGDSLYVVLSGGVRIVKGGVDIAVLPKGACFGEMAVLDQAPRSADAVVSEEAMLLRIGAEEFYDALAENPALIQGVIRLLTKRLREANARIAHTDA